MDDMRELLRQFGSFDMIPGAPVKSPTRSALSPMDSRDEGTRVEIDSARLCPRRAAQPTGRVNARARILAAASELFYLRGTHITGIDTVIDKSGVAKASLYRSFRSKDELITAYAEEQERLFSAWWDSTEADHADNPRAQLVALLSGIAIWIRLPSYRGCPFINLATDLPDRAHPGRITACHNKQFVRMRLAALARRLGVQNPDRTAGQISLLINGAYVAGLMADAPDLERDLVDAALALLDE